MKIMIKVIEMDSLIADAYWGRAYNHDALENYEDAYFDYRTYLQLVGEDNAPDWMLERLVELVDELEG